MSNDELRKLRGDIEKTGKGAIREAAVISASDIARMKASAKITTEADAAAQKRIHEEQKAQQ